MTQTITPIEPTHVLSFVVEQTPHPCLNVNARVDPRKVAKHKAELVEATVFALHNALIADESLEARLLGHQLRMDSTLR